MKVYRIIIYKIFGIILICLLTLSTFAAKDTSTVNKTLSEFGAGVNISHFEQYWKSSDDIYKANITDKINAIADKGFKTIRLPIAFDLFLQPDGITFQNGLIQRLKEIIILTYSLKMKLIIKCSALMHKF